MRFCRSVELRRRVDAYTRLFRQRRRRHLPRGSKLSAAGGEQRGAGVDTSPRMPCARASEIRFRGNNRGNGEAVWLVYPWA